MAERGAWDTPLLSYASAGPFIYPDAEEERAQWPNPQKSRGHAGPPLQRRS
jgi:hypothetical protein